MIFLFLLSILYLSLLKPETFSCALVCNRLYLNTTKHYILYIMACVHILPDKCHPLKTLTTFFHLLFEDVSSCLNALDVTNFG